MRNLLKPGGVLVCEDLNASSIRTEPPTQVYCRLIEISRALDAQQGLDSEIGLKVPHLFRTHSTRANAISFAFVLPPDRETDWGVKQPTILSADHWPLQSGRLFLRCRTAHW